MVQNQTSLQETTIKEETEGLGIEYTNYSPDYSLYQRDYVATGESEPVETGRSRYRIHRWCFEDESVLKDPLCLFVRWELDGVGCVKSDLGCKSKISSIISSLNWPKEHF